MRTACILGTEWVKGGVRPDQSDVQAVTKMERLHTNKKNRSFLEMVGYYRRFIPHFATKAEPLMSLTKKRKTRKRAMDKQRTAVIRSS